MSLTRIGRPSCDRGADDPLPEAQANRARHFLRIADRVGDAQLLALVLEEIDRERGEAGQARDQLRNLGEQLIEVEDGRDFASELEQGRQQLCVGGRPGGPARPRRVRVGHEMTGLY